MLKDFKKSEIEFGGNVLGMSSALVEVFEIFKGLIKFRSQPNFMLKLAISTRLFK